MFTITKDLTKGKAYRCIQDDLKYDGSLVIEQDGKEIVLKKSDVTKLLNLDNKIKMRVYKESKERQKKVFIENIPKLISVHKEVWLKKNPTKSKGLFEIRAPYNNKVLYRVRGSWGDVVNFAFSKKAFIQISYNYLGVHTGTINKIAEPTALKIIELGKSQEKKNDKG